MSSAKLVYCVHCIPDDIVHIFSTMEKAEEYCQRDRARHHLIFDYVIDHPERMEQRQV
jgi:hypothetical protein